MADPAAPIRTADMDPQEVAELLKKKMMKAKLLISAKDQELEHFKGSGNIYAQHLLQSTKNGIEDRKVNQDLYSSGLNRSVFGEVELTNYGPCLVENYQWEKNRREENKEVFTPDISRTVFDKGDNHHNYTKSLNESQRAERIRQLGNKGAHSGDLSRKIYGGSTGAVPEDNYGPCLVENYKAEKIRREKNKEVFTPDISRTVFDKGDNHHNYTKSLNESQRAEKIRQLKNQGAHSGELFRKIYSGSTGAIPEVVNSKQKAIQQEPYLKQNIERQQRFLAKREENEAARQAGLSQHEDYQRQVPINRLWNSKVTGV